MDDGDTRTVRAFHKTWAAADAYRRPLDDLCVPSSDITVVEGADGSDPGRPHEEIGFFDSIVDVFECEDDNQVDSECLRRNGPLMTASASPETCDRALDPDERSETWRSENRTGDPVSGAADTGTHTDPDRHSVSDGAAHWPDAA